MNDLNLLLDKIKEMRSIASDNALAGALGVKRQTVSNWRHGHNLPDAVACATIAGLTGEPLAKVLGIVGEARAISNAEKSVWRSLAASAAMVALLAVITLPAQGASADRHGTNGSFSQNSRILSIMSACRSAAIRLLRDLRHFLRLRFGRKVSGPHIEARNAYMLAL